MLVIYVRYKKMSLSILVTAHCLVSACFNLTQNKPFLSTRHTHLRADYGTASSSALRLMERNRFQRGNWRPFGAKSLLFAWALQDTCVENCVIELPVKTHYWCKKFAKENVCWAFRSYIRVFEKKQQRRSTMKLSNLCAQKYEAGLTAKKKQGTCLDYFFQSVWIS